MFYICCYKHVKIKIRNYDTTRKNRINQRD